MGKNVNTYVSVHNSIWIPCKMTIYQKFCTVITKPDLYSFNVIIKWNLYMLCALPDSGSLPRAGFTRKRVFYTHIKGFAVCSTRQRAYGKVRPAKALSCARSNPRQRDLKNTRKNSKKKIAKARPTSQPLSAPIIFHKLCIFHTQHARRESNPRLIPHVKHP